MKFHPRVSPRSSLPHSHLKYLAQCTRTTLLVWATLAVLPIARPETHDSSELNIGVRTQLDRNKVLKSGQRAGAVKPAAEHGKLYGILNIQGVDSGRKLVKPLDTAVIKQELIRQLDAHGYHRAGRTQRPEILLTVVCGRSWLPNPYYTDNIDVDNMGPQEAVWQNDFQMVDAESPHSSGPDGTTIDNPKVANRLLGTGASEKATRSNLEKLFILVRAWNYPTDPKEKPHVLWVATMFVDDPDHHDLNAIAAQMLETGAPFFDREIPEVGVEVLKKPPEGRVNVGTPEVVPEPKK